MDNDDDADDELESVSFCDEPLYGGFCMASSREAWDSGLQWG